MYSIEEIKEFFKRKGYNLYSDEYKSNKQYLIFEKDGYLYYNTYNGFIKTNSPKKWGVSNPYSNQNINRYMNENNIPCKLLSEKYNYNLMDFQCECGNIYQAPLNNVLRGQFQCPNCGREKGAENHIDWTYLKELEEDGLKLVGDYNGAKYTSFFKNKEGFICPIVPYNYRHTAQSFERNIYGKDNPYLKYNYEQFIVNSGLNCKIAKIGVGGTHDDIDLFCQCGRQYSLNAWYFREYKIDVCSSCRDKAYSSYEKKVADWLKENNIEYIKEKTFEGLKDKSYLRFDFYLPIQNKVVEVDGAQHYKPIPFFCKTETEKEYLDLIKRDNIKNKYCKDNGIGIIRIPFTDFKGDLYKDKLRTFIS